MTLRPPSFWLTAMTLALCLAGLSAPTPAAPRSAAPTPTAPPSAPTGGRIDLNLDGVEVRQALRILADLSGQGLIIDEDITGTVTLQVRDLPWQEALELILASKRLTTEPHGRALRILNKERQEERPAAEFVAIPLRHLPVEQAAALLEGRPWQTASSPVSCGSEVAPPPPTARATPAATRPMASERAANLPASAGARLLSPKGQVLTDLANARLLVKDSPSRLASLQRLLGLLDQPTRQVMLEARIVIADTTFSRNLGVRLGARWARGSSLMILPATLTDASPLSTATTDLLRVELDALEETEKGRVIANPRVMTLNRTPAVITQGEQLPIQNSTTTNGSISTQTTYKDALLCLRVAPNILDNHLIELDIEVHKDSRGRSLNSASQGAEAFPIDTHRLKTRVRVKDGETLILGGIYQEDRGDNQSAIPLLTDLPLLGRLFRSEGQTRRDRELLVFLTPHLVDSPP